MDPMNSFICREKDTRPYVRGSALSSIFSHVVSFLRDGRKWRRGLGSEQAILPLVRRWDYENPLWIPAVVPRSHERFTLQIWFPHGDSFAGLRASSRHSHSQAGRVGWRGVNYSFGDQSCHFLFLMLEATPCLSELLSHFVHTRPLRSTCLAWPAAEALLGETREEGVLYIKRGDKSGKEEGCYFMEACLSLLALIHLRKPLVKSMPRHVIPTPTHRCLICSIGEKLVTLQK